MRGMLINLLSKIIDSRKMLKEWRIDTLLLVYKSKRDREGRNYWVAQGLEQGQCDAPLSIYNIWVRKIGTGNIFGFNLLSHITISEAQKNNKHR